MVNLQRQFLQNYLLVKVRGEEKVKTHQPNTRSRIKKIQIASKIYINVTEVTMDLNATTQSQAVSNKNEVIMDNYANEQ